MTLKEKFRDKILSFKKDNMKEQNAINCEKIADEFAIGFAEWLVQNYDGIKSVKELLEIYKKEKEL